MDRKDKIKKDFQPKIYTGSMAKMIIKENINMEEPMMPNVAHLEAQRRYDKSKFALELAEAVKEAKQSKPIIIEEPDANIANQLLLSGEFCQPRFSEHRNCYILIRRKG